MNIRWCMGVSLGVKCPISEFPQVKACLFAGSRPRRLSRTRLGACPGCCPIRVASSASASGHPGHEREGKGEYPAWARSLRDDQCEEVGLPCFFGLLCTSLNRVRPQMPAASASLTRAGLVGAVSLGPGGGQVFADDRQESIQEADFVAASQVVGKDLVQRHAVAPIPGGQVAGGCREHISDARVADRQVFLMLPAVMAEAELEPGFA